jgi:hypothetical protein
VRADKEVVMPHKLPAPVEEKINYVVYAGRLEEEYAS